jgi:purine-binding chemotaxis protein CheW
MSKTQPTPDAAEVQRILQERARALARVPVQEAAVRTIPLIEVAVGEERFGIDLQQVQEIQPLKGLTPVPGVGAYWAGVVNLRGQLYPVLDLRRYLQLPGAEPLEGGQLVLVSAAGLKVGLWAGEVLGMREVAPDEVKPSLLDRHGLPQDLVAGVTADLLVVLDLEALLADPRLIPQT